MINLTSQEGINSHRALLNDEKVLKIRELLKIKKYRAVAKEFEISIGSIADIKFRRTWKHI